MKNHAETGGIGFGLRGAKKEGNRIQTAVQGEFSSFFLRLRFEPSKLWKKLTPLFTNKGIAFEIRTGS
jgi:hypothetical protein